jgi:RNA polymerase sigma-70 factor (ECF subfamily)
MILRRHKRNFEKDLYYQFADYMFTICYRYIGNREVAEEVLNNGFLKVFKNLSKFKNRGKNSLRGWIKKIMINECLMFLRRKNDFELLQIENIDENRFIINPDFDSDNQILSIIKKLPVGYRTVFNLYAIEGYTHAEISQRLNIRESTSRSQLTMARKILKEYLIKIGYATVGK